jgi:hypothetical protein
MRQLNDFFEFTVHNRDHIRISVVGDDSFRLLGNVREFNLLTFNAQPIRAHLRR